MRAALLPSVLIVGTVALGATAPVRAAALEAAHAATAELTQEEVAELSSRQAPFLRALGLLVFTTPFDLQDGFGDGPFDPAEADTPLVPGHRPTLQGNGMSLRVNGLDAQSCNECHTIVSNATRPPSLGFGGVGGLVQNALISPSVIDAADSDDPRVQHVPGFDPDMPMAPDGAADFNGRFANPPFLYGGGAVELLAKEMTADLQALLATARTSPPGSVIALDTHGVSFGTVTSVDGAGTVQIDAQGIGPADLAAVAPEVALVVRPFGRKGEFFSMRDFDRGAMQFHFGIQPVEVVGEGVDADGDGVTDEVTPAEMSALHFFDVTNPPPFQEALSRAAARGFAAFQQIGCADCHRPTLSTRSAYLPLAYPEVPTDPEANVWTRVDLRRVGFHLTPQREGVEVPLFADLKRHAMGPGLAESFERSTIPNDEFTTARLWGVHDTGPYLHDGRAATLEQAITLHGGEAQSARDAFVALTPAQRNDLLAFLASLRTPPRPNENLLPLLAHLQGRGADRR